MSEIKIGSVSGNNNVFGNNNYITNNFNSQEKASKVLIREDYFNMMLEIKDLERISLDAYLEEKYELHILKNPEFVKILYKDIFKVLDGIDKEGDNDLLIENGDFVVEYGDYKQTGYPTNLHFAITWLHLKLYEKFLDENPLEAANKMNAFENDFLKIDYDSLSYSNKIKSLKLDLKKERRSKNKLGWSWQDLNEMIELKPNIAGLGINFNAIFNKLLVRNNK